MEIFYRGNGEVIGATKIDEKLLEELRKSEVQRADSKTDGNEDLLDRYYEYRILIFLQILINEIELAQK